MNILNINFTNRGDLNFILGLLHKEKKDAKFLISISNGTKLSILGQKSDFQNLSQFFFMNVLDYDDEAKPKMFFGKEFDILLSKRFTSLNKNSILKYVKKNKELLEGSKTFQDFVNAIGYDNPKEIHEKIFEAFKKDDYSIIEKYKHDFLSRYEYVNLISNSNKKNFILYYEKETVGKEYLESLLEKSNAYGMISYKDYKDVI